MAISMNQVSVPVFVKPLNGLAGCMKKAQALHAEKKYDENTLLSYRFYPDMFSFTRQIEAITDLATSGGAKGLACGGAAVPGGGSWSGGNVIKAGCFGGATVESTNGVKLVAIVNEADNNPNPSLQQDKKNYEAFPIQ